MKKIIQNSKSTLQVVIVFIIIQILFSMFYYYAYKSKPENFYFNTEIKTYQDSQFILEIEAEIEKINQDIIFKNSSLSLFEERKQVIKSFIETTENMIKHKYDFYNFYEKSMPIAINGYIFIIANVGYKERRMYRYSHEKYLIIYDNKTPKTILYEYPINFSQMLKFNKIESKIKYLNKNLVHSYTESIEFLENKEKQFKSRLEALKSERDHPESFGILDFMYFGLTFVSHSDILPNSTLIRNIVMLQRFLELILLVVAINAVSSNRK